MSFSNKNISAKRPNFAFNVVLNTDNLNFVFYSLPSIKGWLEGPCALFGVHKVAVFDFVALKAVTTVGGPY